MKFLCIQRHQVPDDTIENVVYIISTANFIKDYNNVSDNRWYNIIYRITCLICDKKLNLSDTIAENIIAKLYNIQTINDLKSYWSIVGKVFELFDTETNLNLDVQFKLWMHIAENIPDYFTNTIILLWKDNEIALAFSFAVWPLTNRMRNTVREELQLVNSNCVVALFVCVFSRQLLMRNGSN